MASMGENEFLQAAAIYLGPGWPPCRCSSG